MWMPSDKIAGGFGAGFADSTNQMLQNKIQLAMLSKRIEMENQAKLNYEQQLMPLQEAQREREAQFSSQLGSVTPQQLGGLSNLAAAGNMDQRQQAESGLGALFPNGVPSHAMQAVLASQGSGMRAQVFDPMHRPEHFSSTDQYGHVREITQLPNGQVLSDVDKGLSNDAQKEIAAAEGAYQSGHANISRLSNQLQSILTAQTAGQRPEQIAKLTLNKITQADPNAAALLSQLKAYSQTFEKDFTKAAPRSASLVAGFGEALPNITDTAQVAQQKLTNMDSMLTNARQGTYKAYNIPIPGDRQQVSANGNPLGPMSNASDPFADLRGK